MAFTPLINYSGYEHVLNCMPTFFHQNGNVYGIAIEKQGGLRQNLSVYRVRPGSLARELVKRYVGGVDTKSQIAAGGCGILQDGSLWVWASAVPKELPPITQTGFVGGFFDPIPGVDDPWSGGTPGPSGGVVLFDAPITNPAWEGRAIPANSGIAVDIPSTFGVPAAAAYLVRFVVQSDAPNVRVRAGTQAAPFILTCNTQIANVQVHTQGWAPGPICYVSTVNGAAVVWFRLVGM